MNMHSKYDNMHRNGMFYVLIFIDNHVIKSISCVLSSFSLTYDDLHLPIALYKCMYAHTLHPISLAVNNDHSHPSYRSFALALAAKLIPGSHMDAMVVPH